MFLHPSISPVAGPVADDRGAMAIEYALLVALVSAVLLISVFGGIGDSLIAMFEATAEGLELDLPEG